MHILDLWGSVFSDGSSILPLWITGNMLCYQHRINSKYFYSYAKKFNKVKTGIGPLLDAAKTLVSCPAKMAEMLKTQYDTVFSTPLQPMMASTDIFNETSNSDIPILSDIYLAPVDIEEAIDELSANSAAGPDQFPAILLKQCKCQGY